MEILEKACSYGLKLKDITQVETIKIKKGNSAHERFRIRRKMSFNQPCEYVRKTDEKHGVPMTIYWTEEELADWICEIGYPQYRVCFEKNFLSGRHLVYLDASKLPDIGITDFEHIKDIAGKIRGLIGLDHVIKNLSIAKSNPMIAYMDMKRKSGDVAMNIPYNEFLKKNKRWYK